MGKRIGSILRSGTDLLRQPAIHKEPTLAHTAHVLILLLFVSAAAAQSGLPTNWDATQTEAISILQRLIQIRTANPPGNEKPAAGYLKSIFDKEGIEAELFEFAPNRANVLAHLKGSGQQRPILLMSHIDVVNVEPSLWTVDPFAADIRDGYIYGRGVLDDKGMTVANLMAVLLLKRSGARLKRDVYFMAEGDEEQNGQGITWMTAHRPELFKTLEFAINEGGRMVTDKDGKIRFVGVQNTEKRFVNFKLKASGTSGHSSVPRPDNVIVHIGQAVARAGTRQMQARLNPTTRRFFQAMANAVRDKELAALCGRIAAANNQELQALTADLARYSLSFNSIVRTSVVPTIVQGGVQSNVIPGAAEANINVRMLPDEDVSTVLSFLKETINDPQIEISAEPAEVLKVTPSSFEGALFEAVEKTTAKMTPGTIVTPFMSTGATDSAELRRLGIQAYGLSPFPIEESEEKRVHGNDERLKLESFRFGLEFTARTVWKVAVQ